MEGTRANNTKSICFLSRHAPRDGGDVVQHETFLRNGGFEALPDVKGTLSEARPRPRSLTILTPTISLIFALALMPVLTLTPNAKR